MGPGSEPDFDSVPLPTSEQLKKNPWPQGDPGDETSFSTETVEPLPAGTIIEVDRGHVGYIRQFDTGATRNRDEDQLDYHGFLSPLARKRYAKYMHEHRRQADGSLRASDNWQKGIPTESYCSSLVRHVTDAELHQDGFPEEARDDLETALCAVIFNAQGWLFELLKERKEWDV